MPRSPSVPPNHAPSRNYSVSIADFPSKFVLTRNTATKNVSLTACGAEVRNNGSIFEDIGITGIIIAFAAFVLRMLASIGKGGRQISWDDATMAVVVLLAIPPAVFAPMRKSPSKMRKGT